MPVLKFMLSVWLLGLLITAGSVSGQTDLPSDAIRSVQWSPSGDAIAVGTEGDGLTVYDAETLDVVFEFADTEHSIENVEWSHNGEMLAATFDDRIYIWDATDFQLLHILSGHVNIISSVSWSPDDSKLASTNYGGNPLPIEVGMLKIWNIGTGQETLSKLIPSGSVAWNSITGELVGFDGLRMVTIDPLTGASQSLCETCVSDAAYDIRWSPNGNKLVTSTRSYLVVYNSAIDVTVGILTGSVNNYSVSWSPEGTLIVSGDSTGKVQIWDVETQALVKEFQTDNDEVYAVDWSPDGAWIAYGGTNGVLGFYDAAISEAIQP